MRTINVCGNDCLVNGDMTVDELTEFAKNQPNGLRRDHGRVAGWSRNNPHEIYVAKNSRFPKASTFLHEIIHPVIWSTSWLKQLLQSAGKEEDAVLALEDGIYNAYKSYGHELPEPNRNYSKPTKWRFRD